MFSLQYVSAVKHVHLQEDKSIRLVDFVKHALV